MKAVDLKTLKAKLGEYVRMAKAGETILVTEREDVVAELRPARRQPPAADRLEERLDALAERDEATLRSVQGPWSRPRPTVRRDGVSSQLLLDALREHDR